MDTSDINALGRMLASEAKEENVKIIIGWITVQVAKRRKISIYQLLTKGEGYGPQDRGMYASTAKDASTKDLELARKILSGELVPSEGITKHIPGAWVERNQGLSDEKILALQERWGEGIYGQIKNSKWVLFSRDTKPIKTLAKDLLDNLPVL